MGVGDAMAAMDGIEATPTTHYNHVQPKAEGVGERYLALIGITAGKCIQ